MTNLFYKQMAAVAGIVISIFIFIVFLTDGSYIGNFGDFAFVAFPIAQILICLDLMKHIKQDVKKEQKRDAILREQKKENEILHTQHTKQKFERRMQQYDENALARKRKRIEKQTKQTTDPEELKELLTSKTNRQENDTQSK
jgi:hypothetical protein